MRVLISGAGIAGLTLAHWLQRYGFEPVLVERMPEGAPSQGYLIDFWGPGYTVAERMGLLEALGQRHHDVENWSLVNRRGKTVVALNVEQFASALDGRFFTFYRGDLEEVLQERIADRVAIRRGTSIETMHAAEDHVETLCDGKTERWDLVVGADGIHSNVRALAFGEEARFIRHLGCRVAASEALADVDLPRASVCLFNRPGKLAMLFPCAGGKVVFYLVHRTDNSDWTPPPRRAAHLRSVFSDVGWVVPDLLDCLSEDSPIFEDTVSQIQMPSWSRGRIALVGDACQCLTLLAGQGASMAMVGAYRLAGELSRAGGDFSTAFARYEAKLKPAIESRQREAKWMSRWLFLPQTHLGIAGRNCMMKLLSMPLLNRFLLPSLAADEELEDYGNGST